MIGRILVPLDGSALAERALPTAETLARASGASLLLVRAAWVAGLPDSTWGRAQTEAAEDGRVYLQGLRDSLSGKGLDVESQVVFGDPAGVILDVQRARQADLIVMATHGRAGMGRLIFGSVTQAVLSGSPVPVLAVRALEEAPSEFPAAPRILVPLDGSRFAEAILPAAVDLAGALQGRLLLFSAVPPRGERAHAEPSPTPSTADLEAERERAEREKYLLSVRDRLGLDASMVEVEATVGKPVDAILSVCHEREVALVAMSTHGRSGLGRLLMGGVAGAVLRRGGLPLLLIRPSGLSDRPAAAVQEQSAPEAAGPSSEAGAATRAYPSPISPGVGTRAPDDTGVHARAEYGQRILLADAGLIYALGTGTVTRSEATFQSPAERLLATVERHASMEEESLREYREMADACPDALAQLLMRLVLHDEERHHDLLRRMAASLQDSIGWTHSPNALPDPYPSPDAATPEVIHATRQRVEEEREHVRYLRKLAREEGSLSDGLFGLLLEVMALDSEKHERIMSYLLRRFENASKAAAARG